MAVKQISLFLENKAGELAEITRLLASNGVNLSAINIAETADYGIVRIIADDPQKAAQVLSENDFIISVTPVVRVNVPDRTGGLNEILEVMAEKNIDVEYMYSVFASKDGTASMIFKVSDTEKLEKTLAELS